MSPTLKKLLAAATVAGSLAPGAAQASTVPAVCYHFYIPDDDDIPNEPGDPRPIDWTICLPGAASGS